MSDNRDDADGQVDGGATIPGDSGAPKAGDESGAGETRIGSVSLARVATWTLALAVGLSALGVVYVAVTPPAVTDSYSELYLLDSNGTASDYPTNLTPGETGTFVVGVANHEHETLTYRIELRYGERAIETIEPTVADGETWEDEVSFEADAVGQERLRILLFRGDGGGTSGDPYRETSLLVNVSAPPEQEGSGGLAPESE